MSSYFSGTFGALVMSAIAMSIVFLVIIGLMVVMNLTRKAAEMTDGSKAAVREVK